MAIAANNHRAIWLGGGGVGKTRTLSMVVQPLAETYFGSDGYCATAQSNHAAQNLGSRGRTLHAANGLLMTDSLQTARLRCNAQTQRKMDRLVALLAAPLLRDAPCSARAAASCISASKRGCLRLAGGPSVAGAAAASAGAARGRSMPSRGTRSRRGAGLHAEQRDAVALLALSV